MHRFLHSRAVIFTLIGLPLILFVLIGLGLLWWLVQAVRLLIG